MSYIGGGIFNLASSPTVTNCTFIQNTADTGGGMYNSGLGDGDGSNPIVNNCTFSANNSTGSGGGMFNRASNPVVTNCTFLGNSAGGSGGGMCNTVQSNPSVTGCVFSGNSSTSSFSGGGGGMSNSTSSPTVTNCSFIENTATGATHGGGMYNFLSSPMVDSCTFEGNTAIPNGRGGGISNWSESHSTVTNCTFAANDASFGGGMANTNSSGVVVDCRFIGNTAPGNDGGGMWNFQSSPTVTNCTFNGNSAPGGLYVISSGGGMCNIRSAPMVANCTFSYNTADFCGGIANSDNSNPTISNCTLSGNSAEDDGGAICNGGHSSPTVATCILWGNSPNGIASYSSAPLISFSNIQGSGGSDGWDASLGTDAGGNIDADPLFVDIDGADNAVGTADDNLRLLPGSPSINTGYPALIPGPTETDLDGHARVLCVRVDMGAYEFGIGDFDCDQIVTLTDFADWAGCMTAPEAQSISPACEAFDFEFDGDVDLIDWAGFQNAFAGP